MKSFVVDTLKSRSLFGRKTALPVSALLIAIAAAAMPAREVASQVRADSHTQTPVERLAANLLEQDILEVNGAVETEILEKPSVRAVYLVPADKEINPEYALGLENAMKDIHPDARLLIGGVGPLTPKLKELVARLGLEKRINFLGLIKEKDLPAYYQASDIFCLPAISQAEAFGIVQVEAMASGLPVVSTELHNGVSYVNRDGVSGLIVPPNDSNALAIAINKLLDNDELRNKLAMQARERALKEFSFESMGQRMLKLYEDVVAART